MTAPICPLCRRPFWIDGARMAVYCAADPVSRVGASYEELNDCRRIALRVASLVAPVVEAAEEYFDNDDSLLDRAVRAMRDGLAKLGTP